MGHVNNLRISPSSISFADTSVKTYSEISTVRLTNDSHNTINVFSINLPDGFVGDFAGSTAYNQSISGFFIPSTHPVNSYQDIDIVFYPSNNNTYGGLVSIDSDAPTSDDLTVSGTGVRIVNQLDYSPTKLDYGNVIINESSILQITFTNNGSSDRDVTFTIEGAYTFKKSTDSVYDVTLTETIAVGDSLIIDINFNPTAVGNNNNFFTVNISGGDVYYIPLIANCVAGVALNSLITVKAYEAYVVENLNDYQYIDFDMKMPINENSGISYKTEAYAVMQSIKNILLSKKLFGDNNFSLDNFIFENIDTPFFLSGFKSELDERIRSFEPRVDMLNINLSIDENDVSKYHISIEFSIKSNTGVFYRFPLMRRIR